jgi:hypothetical protein
MLRNDRFVDVEIVPGAQTSYSTIYYQGIFGSQVHITKYIGDHELIATTGEKISCDGRNNLKPLDLLINPVIGKEIKDVNTRPFSNWQTALSPVTWLATGLSAGANWYYGVQVVRPENDAAAKEDSVKYYAPVISEISISQETDMESHYEKYKLWKQTAKPGDKLILFGVSRGAGTTFNAFAEYKYPEVSLVILEGCFSSVEDVLERRYGKLSGYVSSGISMFSKYRKDGPSPLKYVDQFPEGVPIVFITSKADKEVPSVSTKILANALAAKNKNEVFLLELETSPHPNYMFDNAHDRNNYETFIHAIYKKYNCPYRAELAEKGEHLLEQCRLVPECLRNVARV